MACCSVSPPVTVGYSLSATMAVKAEGSQRAAAVSLGAWDADHVSWHVTSDPLLSLHTQVYFCVTIPGTCSKSIVHVPSWPMSRPVSVPGSRDEHWLHSLRDGSSIHCSPLHVRADGWGEQNGQARARL